MIIERRPEKKILNFLNKIILFSDFPNSLSIITEESEKLVNNIKVILSAHNLLAIH